MSETMKGIIEMKLKTYKQEIDWNYVEALYILCGNYFKRNTYSINFKKVYTYKDPDFEIDLTIDKQTKTFELSLHERQLDKTFKMTELLYIKMSGYAYDDYCKIIGVAEGFIYKIENC